MTESGKKVIMVANTNRYDPHRLTEMLRLDGNLNQYDIREYDNFPAMYGALDNLLAQGTLPAAIIVDDTHTNRMSGNDMMGVIREKPELNDVPVCFFASREYSGPTPHPKSTATFFRDAGEQTLLDFLHRKLKSQADRLADRTDDDRRRGRTS